MVHKTHIYFVPGLAACSKIFEYLQFSEDKYVLHFLEWLVPESKDEPLESYAERMASLVKNDHAVLIGVSFGGIMVQEMSKFLKTKKVIIISSVKSREELPKRLKIIQKSKAYKLFPTKAISNIEEFSVYAFGDFIKKRIQLYKEYLSMRNTQYLEWAIFHVLHWSPTKPVNNLIHIHGVDDGVFPIKHINNCIEIENGTHIMILNKAKIISKIIDESLIC
jgi:hypothetical protein